MRVVVGEDSLLAREGIVRLLQDAGYAVVGQGWDLPLSHAGRGAGVARTSWSSTSGCRPPSPTRGWSPLARSVNATPDTGVLVLSQYVEPSVCAAAARGAPRRRRLPAQGEGVRRRRCSSTPCAASPTTRPWSTPASCSRLVGRHRRDGPPRPAHRTGAGSARSHRRRDCPTPPSRGGCSSPNELFRRTPRRSHQARPPARTRTRTGACSRSSPTSSTVPPNGESPGPHAG